MARQEIILPAKQSIFVDMPLYVHLKFVKDLIN